MTSHTKPPRAPVGLGPRGRRFWRDVTSEFTLDVAEVQLLIEVCRLMDEAEQLAAMLADDGMTTEGSRGQRKVHPAVAELRATRLAVGRLLAQLSLPDEEGATLPTPMRARGRRAAAARWGGVRGTA